MSKRFLIPFFVLALTSCGGNAVSSSVNPAGLDLFFALPKSEKVESLDPTLARRSAEKAFNDLLPAIYEMDGSGVVSPASYVLAAAGVAAVSEGMDNEAFGFKEDASKDLSDFLTAWNFEYQYKKAYGSYGTEEEYCRFDSVILHQQVGPTYHFDPAKQKELETKYIATMRSSVADYHKDAVEFFNNKLGYKITPPDPHFSEDGLITYGAFRMKDYVPGGLGISKKLYRGEETDAYSFGSIYYPDFLPYVKGENYSVFSIDIRFTNMVIVLPDEGVAIKDVDLGAAYHQFQAEKQTVMAVGYVPYFHANSQSVDLTPAVARKLNGRERFFQKVLADDVVNDLGLACVLQSSDFEFNQYGVSGESITMMAYVGAPAPEEHEVVYLEVNRPFYAISQKDGFPLFVNKVVNLRP